MSAAKRGGDAAHREQLVELRGWCESEVRTERERERERERRAEREGESEERESQTSRDRGREAVEAAGASFPCKCDSCHRWCWHGMAWDGMEWNDLNV